jgi:hypothetical protein
LANEKTKTKEQALEEFENATSQPSQLLTDEQLVKLQRTVAYGMAMAGVLANGKQPTPTPRNLQFLKEYADAILEMVNGN